MTLEERLEQERSSEKWTDENIQNVSNLIEYSKGKKNISYSFFLKEFEDFHLYYELHMEWKGKSSTEMQRDFKTGGSSFYQAFYRWVKKKTKDVSERKDLMTKLFKTNLTILNDWTKFKTYDDWITEFSRHTEWQSLSITEMKRNMDCWTRNFAVAYYLWVKKQTGDKSERIALMQRLFKSKRRDWASLTTIDDWITEYNCYGWKGRSARKVMKESKEGNNFCRAFYSWVNNQTGDHKKRQILRGKLFKRKLNDWTNFRTIDYWIKEYYQHTEWKKKSSSELQRDVEFGGCAFYQSFYKWARKQEYPKVCRSVLSFIINGGKIKRNIEDSLAYYYDNYRDESSRQLIESNPYLFLRLNEAGLLKEINN